MASDMPIMISYDGIIQLGRHSTGHEGRSTTKRRLRLHVVLTFLLVELTLFLRRRVLVLLVLAHEIVHVALRFGEFHLVHPLTRVPVQEGLAAEHAGELLGNTLEHLLDRRRVP